MARIRVLQVIDKSDSTVYCIHMVCLNSVMTGRTNKKVKVQHATKLCHIFFFRILSHFYVGSMCLMRRLHLTRSCTSSPDNSLRQVVPDAIQPSLLWSSSTFFPRHFHRHHSLAYVFVFSSQYMPILCQRTFLHFLVYCISPPSLSL